MKIPDLRDYDKIVISTSGGKDSSVAAWKTARLAEEAGVKNRLLLAHATFKEEWDGTVDVVRLQADQLGLPFEVVRRVDQGGREESLLDYVRRRRMWPSPAQRYCTSDFKRDPIGKLVTRVAPGIDRRLNVLHVMGIRAQESKKRAKKLPFEGAYGRWTNGRRLVDVWFPIFEMKLEEVWSTIKANSIPQHGAYALGMPRLSCRLCIFAPKEALVLAGRHNRELLEEYVKVEREIGHKFRQDLSMAEVLAAVEAGEEISSVPDWKM